MSSSLPVSSTPLDLEGSRFRIKASTCLRGVVAALLLSACSQPRDSGEGVSTPAGNAPGGAGGPAGAGGGGSSGASGSPPNAGGSGAMGGSGASAGDAGAGGLGTMPTSDSGAGLADAPIVIVPGACMAGSPPLCDGTSLKECQNDGSFRISPCNRGCAAGACCGGDSEAMAAACGVCGALGQACCKIAMPACGAGLTCESDKCVVPCGDGPGQRCCEGNTIDCVNNCGTAGGKKMCMSGSYGACSLADSCCGDRSCTNNCGEKGTKPCNGTSLGACPVPRRDCCSGESKSCSNSCGTAHGTIACKNGKFSDNDCSVKNSPCPGEKGQMCKDAGKCNSGLFCCDFCMGSTQNTCQPQKGQRGDCGSQKECQDKFVCNLDENKCCPKTCPAFHHCLNGDCRAEPGQPCKNNSDCTTESCTAPDPLLPNDKKCT
jgi:hypothetical protein